MVLLLLTFCLLSDILFIFSHCHLDWEERELVAFLNLSSWLLVIVEQLFLTVPRGCLRFVIVVFSDHTHLLFFGLIIT